MPKNCWDFMNCEKEKTCIAYPAYGRICWLVASTHCRADAGEFATGIGSCSQCPWFKELSSESDESIQHWLEHKIGIRKLSSCWEFWNCGTETQSNCPAYPSAGKNCWSVVGRVGGGTSTCPNAALSRFAKHFESHLEGCGDCPWYLLILDDSRLSKARAQ